MTDPASPDLPSGPHIPACVRIDGSAATVALPFLPSLGKRWDEAATDLWCSDLVEPFGPPVTGADPIARWTGEDLGAGGGGVREAVAALVGAGVAFEDLVRLAVVGASGPVAPVQRVAPVLVRALREMARRWPDLALRDAIGWLLWAWIGVGFGTSAAAIHLERWLDTDVPRDGWVFALAGLSVDETVAGLADGTVDREMALVLAGLRGPLMPVTVAA